MPAGDRTTPDATEPTALDRRSFLGLLGAAGATAAVGGVGASTAGWLGSGALPAGAAPTVDPAFPFGIASGDPLPDGTTIWTAVDGTADTGGGVEVTWEVASDQTFALVLATGSGLATAARDHTFRALVGGLQPDTWYAYRFTYGDHTSRTGRLRTAPAPDASPDELRFTFCSCQQITASYYVAHAAMAAEDLDFVIHYGDYVYVSDGGTITLEDYWGVYRRFKANPWLQELHATVPMVAMWDDGEFVNGIDKTLDPARLDAARQAWFDYLPFDRPDDDPNRTYRQIAWGDLVDVLMLDVRTHRDKLIDANTFDTLLPTTDTALPSGAAIFEEGRSSLGATQKAWFLDRLTTSTARWRHIGTGYPFVALRLEDYDTPEARANPPEGFHVNGGKYLSTEQWDGYWAERREIMDTIADECIENVVITSGHTHIYFASGIRPDYDDLEGSPVVAWEFTTGSLTADPDAREQYFPDLPPDEAEQQIHGLEAAFLALNPHVDYIDLLNQGYGLVSITRDRCQVDFRVIDTYDEAATPTTKKTYRVAAGVLPDSADCHPDEVPPTTVPTTTTTTPTAPGADAVDGTASYTG